MSEIDQSPPARGRGLIAALFGMFVLGVLAMGWLLTSTDMGRGMMGQDPAPTTARPQALAQTQPAAPNTPNAPPSAVTPAIPQMQGDITFRLATLEGRVASLEARPMGGATVSAPKAEALFLVLASARKFERGQPLGTLERELTARFGLSQANAVSALSRWTRQPVTAAHVRRDFEMMVPASASGEGGWWDRLTNGIGALMTVRDQSSPSTAPAHLVTQARSLLDVDDVTGAIAIARQLPQSDGVKGWIAQALRYTQARQALDQLEEQALSGEPAAAAAPRLVPLPAPTPTPAPVTEPALTMD
jgi:hypothetical protein